MDDPDPTLFLSSLTSRKEAHRMMPCRITRHSYTAQNSRVSLPAGDGDQQIGIDRYARRQQRDTMLSMLLDFFNSRLQAESKQLAEEAASGKRATVLTWGGFPEGHASPEVCKILSYRRSKQT